MNDDLWDRARGLGSETWKGWEWVQFPLQKPGSISLIADALKSDPATLSFISNASNLFSVCCPENTYGSDCKGRSPYRLTIHQMEIFRAASSQKYYLDSCMARSGSKNLAKISATIYYDCILFLQFQN